MIFENVTDAVWVSVATMAYNQYHRSIEHASLTSTSFHFSQSDIIREAQRICRQTVQNARVSQWYNADHPEHTHKFLRAEGPLRRLTFGNEFNGSKEIPDTLNHDIEVDTIKGSKKISELIEFVHNEYAQLMQERNQTMKTTIQIKDILDFLLIHGGTFYRSPEKEENEEQRNNILALKELGRKTGDEFSKLGQFFTQAGYVFDKTTASRWLDGSGNGIRDYFWIELKLPEKRTSPSSISIFAEKKNNEVNYRVSLEIKDSKSDGEHYNRHLKFLDHLNPETSDFEYYLTERSGLGLQVVPEEDIQATIEKTKRREYHKIQIGKRISYDQVLQMNSDQLLTYISEVVAALDPYYRIAVAVDDTLEQQSHTHTESADSNGGHTMEDKNIILYGPPGTGKTYHTVKYALAIIEGKSLEQIEEEVQADGYSAVFSRYKKYKDQGQIAFTTFHQSYGYEEFIEGIKPVIDGENENEIKYALEPGVFKDFCDTASKLKVISHENTELLSGNPTIWKISLEGAGVNTTKTECFKNNCIRIGWDDHPQQIDYQTECDSSIVRDILIDFQDTMNIGDIVLSLFNQSTIDGIGIVTGDYVYDDTLVEYKRKRSVRWLATDIREDIYTLNGNTNLTARTLYKLNRIASSDLVEILKKQQNVQGGAISVEKEKKKYVFIIDEINRGNISKIFGELITLIEPSKRLGNREELTAILPYSKKKFGVPDNVYILGTMNTADRSIAMLDTALRRRFQFIEMMPQPEVLQDVWVQDIQVSALLEMMNKRIEILYDREHMIGHAYFMDLMRDPSIERLANIFKNSIIPLLQEYFYEDYNKIQLVLGDGYKQDEFRFIRAIKLDPTLFGTSWDPFQDEKEVFEINEHAFYNIESYKQIYDF